MERQEEKGRSGKKRKDGEKRGEGQSCKKGKDKAERPINTNYKHPSSKDIMINIIFIYYNIQIRIYIIILYILYSIIRIIHNLSCTKETVFLMPQTKCHFRKR